MHVVGKGSWKERAVGKLELKSGRIKFESSGRSWKVQLNLESDCWSWKVFNEVGKNHCSWKANIEVGKT